MLEKILEEMKKIKDWNRKENLYAKYPPKDEQGKILNGYSQGYEDGADNFYNAMVDIIRKHMNDGWIPVEERMPEERDSMFATLKGTDKWSKGMFEKISDDVNVTVEYEDGTRKTISAYTLDGQWKLPSRILKQKVIAWCPCPEPYKPKTHDKPPEHWPEWRAKFLGKFDRRM